MKKIKFLIFVFTFILAIVIIFFVVKNTKNDVNESDFSLVEILEEVNLASGESFSEVGKEEVIEYLSAEISNYKNLLIAINSDDSKEYFIVGKNLEKEQQTQIEKTYLNNTNGDYVIFYSNDNYTYLIKSEEYLYLIEGIINSYMINAKDKK